MIKSEHYMFHNSISSVNAIAETFAILGQGSAFMHGSNTKNGESADGRINDLFTYIAYQAAVKNLGDKDNAIIHDLSYAPRYTIIRCPVLFRALSSRFYFFIISTLFESMF